MKFVTLAASAAVLSLALGSAGASAAQINERTCRQLDQQIQVAMDAHAQSPNISAAMTERQTGNSSCTAGFYQLGVNHLNKALALLTSG